MSDVSLFTASGFVEAENLPEFIEKGVDFLALPPILRVLLSTDGTVTKTLESYFWEKVNVVSEKQHLVVGEMPDIGLTMSETSRFLFRQVRLEGKQSNKQYAFARTYIDLNLLPERVADDLLTGKIGVGEVIRSSGLETYRQIKGLGFDTENNAVWRRYQISFNHRAAMEISEFFPLSVYKSQTD